MKKNKPDVPRPEEGYDSKNEHSDEEEFRVYQATYKRRHEERGEVGQSFTQPPLPTTHEKDDPISPYPIKDQVQDLTMRFDAFWDETQEHHV